LTNISLEASVISNKGKLRAKNEDNFCFDGMYLLDENNKDDFERNEIKSLSHAVFSVFDGMGGAACGDIASKMAGEEMSVFNENLRRLKMNSDLMIKKTFSNRISAINEKIVLYSNEERLSSMGSTASGIIINKKTFQPFNLGDSRVYLYRNSKLVQMTVDHTEANQLYQMKLISKEEMEKHPGKNRLTQHLGVPFEYGKVEAEFGESFLCEEGDIILVCSDGLTLHVTDDEIFEILDNDGVVKEKNKALLKRALNDGGKDNITSILLNVVSC